MPPLTVPTDGAVALLLSVSVRPELMQDEVTREEGWMDGQGRPRSLSATWRQNDCGDVENGDKYVMSERAGDHFKKIIP